MPRLGRQLVGQIERVINQNVRADIRRPRVSQENRQRRFSNSKLVLRDLFVRDKVFSL